MDPDVDLQPHVPLGDYLGIMKVKSPAPVEPVAPAEPVAPVVPVEHARSFVPRDASATVLRTFSEKLAAAQDSA